MTAPESRDAQSGVAEVLAGVLAEHLLRDDRATGLVCTCDEWRLTYREVNYPEAQHRAHVAAIQAAALGPLLAAERAKAWDEAIHEAEACGWLHDLAADDMAGRNPHHRANREQP